MTITTYPLPDTGWQYWHTMHVPMDGGVYPVGVYPVGVYPVEVYAPRLVAPRLVAYQPLQIVGLGEPAVSPHVPEPGTWIGVAIGILIGLVTLAWAKKRKRERRAVILDAVRKLGPCASTREIGRVVKGKVSFGALYVELAAMANEGILDSRVEAGGPEREGRDRVFYAIKRKGLEESR